MGQTKQPLRVIDFRDADEKQGISSVGRVGNLEMIQPIDGLPNCVRKGLRNHMTPRGLPADNDGLST